MSLYKLLSEVAINVEGVAVKWIASLVDESTFYLKHPQTHNLISMMTVHVGDLALTTNANVRAQTNKQLDKKFGKTEL